LKYNQNIFSLQVSSINYDYPSNILYSWRLEGFYDKWSKPGTENTIRYTNLAPGKYTLRVRAISNEDKRIMLEERSMDIIIAQPFWLTFWAMLVYTAILCLIAIVLLRILILRKQRKVSDEKIHFFINTAHDIRTPLTLIKAPLEELREKEELSKEGISNMNTALRNVNALLRLTTNLINFERADVYSSELYISEHELNTFMNEIFNAFQQYANIKHINFTYESNFRYMNVWFDKEKMESIFKNIISNALKYTPENGNVQVFVSETTDSWSVEVRDTGIGIPANEQKKLFKLHFRGSNAINSKVTGSGIGLMLVWKLVRLHKGKINLSSIENQGSVIKITFPKDSKRFRKAHLATPSKQRIEIENVPSSSPEIYENAQKKENINHRRILIVEDNDELRNYLSQTLSEEYVVQVCSNGKEALTIIPEYKPELVISDIMMPEMRGDELCQAIKNNIETSHIPVILLTALNNEKDILSGLQIGADEYVVKPFNIGILKANVANLLANRALLRSKYANLDLNDEENDEDCINCSQDIDWKFIANVKKNVEDNIDNPALTVDVLCSLMGMSRTSFYNKLRALTDQAPGDYIRLIRLKRAVQLLKEDTHSITEIAEMTGFSDAKYFREVFKKHFNVSPSQYGKEKKTASKEGGEKKE
ncbi:hybrid sensor histidine kinase/response regulator transcription factor, partial [Bacteroides ovatus]